PLVFRLALGELALLVGMVALRVLVLGFGLGELLLQLLALLERGLVGLLHFPGVGVERLGLLGHLLELALGLRQAGLGVGAVLVEEGGVLAFFEAFGDVFGAREAHGANDQIIGGGHNRRVDLGHRHHIGDAVLALALVAR